MNTPEILYGATRQYRHNSGGDELIMGFDESETIRIVTGLQSQIQALTEERDAMKAALEWIVAQYDEWGDVENVHIENARDALNRQHIDASVDNKGKQNRTHLSTSGDDKGREVCEWRQIDEPESCIWETACGEVYQFTFDGPEENNHKYCHSCGKPIRIVEDKEERDEQ